jgi:hypothetical protein
MLPILRYNLCMQKSSPQSKRCPACGGVSIETAPTCQCGHVFRTQVKPATVASGPPPVRVNVPPPPIDPATYPWNIAKARQHATVLSDPRYLVDTGTGIGCPSCGSTNLVLTEKGGTGLGYFGSLGFVAGMMLVEGLVQNMQKQPITCNYCGVTFTL